MEPEIEEVYDEFGREDHSTYLSEIGNLYTRLGRNNKVSTFLAGFGPFAIKSQTDSEHCGVACALQAKKPTGRELYCTAKLMRRYF